MKRLLSILLCLILAAGLMLSPAAAAGEGEEGLPPEESAPETAAAGEESQTVDPSAYVLQEGGLLPERPLAAKGGTALRGMLKSASASDLKAAKKAILNGLKAREAYIDLTAYGLDSSEIFGAFLELLNERPELFYVTTSGSYADSWGLVPGYNSSYTEEDQAQFDAISQAIIAGIDPNWTEVQKHLYIHDYIVTHAEYDKTLSKYNAYNNLVEHSSVCQGYTLAYVHLCNLAGLKAWIVSSEGINHSWNLVQIDGEYFYVDNTWDDPSNVKYEAFCMHENFLRSRKGMVSTGHYFEEDGTPYVDWLLNEENAYSQYPGSEEYDSGAWWSNVYSAIPCINGISAIVREDKIVLRSAAGTETEISPTGMELWPVWEESSYWGYYSFVAGLYNSFYYTTPTGIYRMNTAGEMELVHTLSSTQQKLGYIYGVVALDGAIRFSLGTDPWEGETFTQKTLTILPDAPAKVKAVMSGSSVKVSWQAVPGVAKYRLYRTSDGVTTNRYVTGTSWKDNDVEAGKTYTYYLKSVSASGNSGNSAKVSVTVTPQALPAPTGLKVTSGLTGITVKWSAVSGAARYRVIRTVDGVTTKIKVTGTSWTDTDVQADKTYTYAVQAQDSGGTYSAASGAKSLYYPLGIAVKVSGKKANVSWTPVSGATKYQVYRRVQTGSGYGSWVLIYSGKATAFTDTPGSGTWQYRVRAVVGTQKTAYSNRKKITIS